MRGEGTRRAGVVATCLVAAMMGVGAVPAGAATSNALTVSKVAGTGKAAAAHSGAPAATAPLDAPQSVAVDGSGDVAVADTDACRVDVISSHHQRAFAHTMSAGHLYVVAGGSCASHGAVGFPESVAWSNGSLAVVNGAADDVVTIARSGHTTRVAGTGRPGAPRLGVSARTSPLDNPGGVASDAAGDLFIADTGDCRVLMVPHVSGSYYGQRMTGGNLYAIAGTGTCTLSNPVGPARTASLSAPTSVTVDRAGDLFVTESGRQDVDEIPVAGGTYYGVAIGADGIAPVAGSGSNNTFLAEGQPATGSYAEMNYPGGTAVDGAGNLYIADGYDHAVLVVPAHDTVLWGKSLSGGDLYTAAGAVPASQPGGPPGDLTQWVGPRLSDPTDVAWGGGRLVVADTGTNTIVALS